MVFLIVLAPKSLLKPKGALHLGECVLIHTKRGSSLSSSMRCAVALYVVLQHLMFDFLQPVAKVSDLC